LTSLPKNAPMHLPNESTLNCFQASKDGCSGIGIRMGRRWTGVGGGNRCIREGEGAQRGAASQAVGDASPGDGVELVPAAKKQAPGQFTQQIGKRNE
jgi:hypothetical protein